MAQVTISLPEDLLREVERRRGTPDELDLSALTAEAIRRRLRAELDEAFAGVGEDAEYQAEATRLAAEFRHADAEALRLGDDERGDATPD
jgi:hypothetical protein